MIDRRELLHRAAVMLGGAVSASAAAGVLAGCVATPPAEGDAPVDYSWFTPQEAATMTALADQIIPPTDTLGAVAVGTVPYIDNMLANYYEPANRTAFRDGLARADREAVAAHGQPFAALSADQQVALMTAWDQEAYANRDEPHFFRTAKELTTLAFFTSEYGASEFLKYAAVPGELRNDVPYAEIGRAWYN